LRNGDTARYRRGIVANGAKIDEGVQGSRYDRHVTLYVCYGTFGPAERHACARAHKALVAAGHSPKVSRTYGCYRTDPLFGGRRHVKRLTGNFEVPTLVLDDGAVVDGSREIAAWAAANPA